MSPLKTSKWPAGAASTIARLIPGSSINSIMVEADRAKRVDDHQSPAHLRQLRQMVEQRGLATAEKAGEHQHGDQRLLPRKTARSDEADVTD